MSYTNETKDGTKSTTGKIANHVTELIFDNPDVDVMVFDIADDSTEIVFDLCHRLMTAIDETIKEYE